MWWTFGLGCARLAAPWGFCGFRCSQLAAPIYLMPTGTSLRDTLIANWTPVNDIGDPSWVDVLFAAPNPNAVAVLTGLTLLSRRVWLHVGDPDRGTCIRCGGVEGPIVRDCEYEGAPDQKNTGWADPHVVYAADSGRAVTPDSPMAAGRFVTDRPWALLSAHALGSGRLTYDKASSRHSACAFATNKALGVDTWEWDLRSPKDVTDMAKAHEALRAWSQHGRSLARSIARGRTLGSATVSQVRPHIEHLVSQRTRDLLKPDYAAWEQAAEEYAPFMGAIASAISPGPTATATERRRRLVAIRPRLSDPARATQPEEVSDDANPD